MDRRTIIFVIILTIGLFLTNQYFGSKTASEQEHAKKKTQEEIQAKQRVLNERAVSPDQLPIYKLTTDKAGTETLTYVLEFDGQYLTTSWTEALPEVAYVNGREVKLQVNDEIVLYGESDTLETTRLPQVGISDIQMVTLYQKGVTVQVGEYANNTITFPSSPPENSAIALYWFSGKFYPVGIYDAKLKRYRPLFEHPEFKLSYKFAETNQAENQLYVIENAYQQVVISTLGGSISEINLPFRTKENRQSLVRSIGIDRKVQASSPHNSYFPLQRYTSSAGTKDPKNGGYNPLLRRSAHKPAALNANSIISEDYDISTANFKVTNLTKDSIELVANLPRQKIVKTISFAKDPDAAPYMLECSLRVEGDNRGLWLTSGVPEVELISNSSDPALKYRYFQGQKAKVEKVKLPKNSTNFSSINIDWVTTNSGFFGLILDPLDDFASGFKATIVPGELDPTRLTLIDQKQNVYKAAKYPGYQALLPLPQTSKTLKYRLFAGPLATSLLKKLDSTYRDGDYSPEYISCKSVSGFFSFISEPFSKLLFYLISFFHSFTFSWGISIILLTIALRVMLYPLNEWSMKSMAKMQEITPKIEKLKKKYKNDQQKLQAEQLKLYKEGGANPFSGCLPLLVQMPFLFGMFNLLKTTFELRGASFIPGWINDLAAPDVLFSWSRPLFFLGTSFHLLPVLVAGVMYVQQKFSSKMRDTGAELTDQQKQQQKMGSIMTFVFLFFFYSLPSGLNIYWLFSSLLAILQQWIYNRRKKTLCKPGKSS
ncbi:MAG: Membrane protein insertase YidC [Chlamydiia bacterium]|nr:Membrane protein insertase YidC [Chlamydiia bacterium]MCH9615415.1 Membrane protein insertase YidC [Chlamydiia bacterium]MCH9628263.1 Membrane protein insertase YidC [Chlamydiia bacterium]